jgi:hypothetical protein
VLVAVVTAIAVAVPVAAAQSDGAGTRSGGIFPARGEFGEPIDLDEAVGAYEEFAAGLAEHLDDAGIDHEVREVPIVLWDPADPSANEAVVEYLEELGIPVRLLPDPERGWPLDRERFEERLREWVPAEVIEEVNAAADELAAFLDERGVGYRVEEGPLGLRWVIPDLGDPAAREALEEYWSQRHGSWEDFTLDLDDIEIPEFELELGGSDGPFEWRGGGLEEFLDELLGSLFDRRE